MGAVKVCWQPELRTGRFAAVNTDWPTTTRLTAIYPQWSAWAIPEINTFTYSLLEYSAMSFINFLHLIWTTASSLVGWLGFNVALNTIQFISGLKVEPYCKYYNLMRINSWRGFVLCGQGSSLLWTPALRPYSGPVRLPRERKGIGRCVRCVGEFRVKEGLSSSEQLVGYFYSAPLLDVAYCLA